MHRKMGSQTLGLQRPLTAKFARILCSMHEFIARLEVCLNGKFDIRAERNISLPFVPQIGMGFCISNEFHELTVKGPALWMKVNL